METSLNYERITPITGKPEYQVDSILKYSVISESYIAF